MAIRDATQLRQPVAATSVLPSHYPDAPDKLLRAFPAFAEYHEQMERLYKRLRESIRNNADDLALPLNQLKQQVESVHSAVLGDFSARFDEVLNVMAEEDEALAERATILEAQVQTPGTGLLARINTVETTYATTTGVGAAITSAISAEVTDRNTAINYRAGVITEAYALADTTIEGHVSNLAGKYTLKVVAGNVVTGMNITSASGPGGDVSDVTFQAGSFKIYNGSSAVAPFQVVGGVVRVLNLAIGSADVSGLAAVATTGAAANISGLAATATSSDYSAVTGTKPPPGADVTLTAVGGGLAISSGGITLSGTAQIKSWNYNPGVAGWAVLPDGTVDFNNGTFRGTLSAASGTIGGFSIGANILSAGSGLNAIAFSSVTNPFFRIGDVGGFYAEIRTIDGAPQCTVNNGVVQKAYITADIAANCGVIKVLNSSGVRTIELWGNSGGIIGVQSGGYYMVNGQQVVGARQTAPAASPTLGYSPSGTYTSDQGAIYSALQNHMNTINAIRTALIAHGLIG